MCTFPCLTFPGIFNRFVKTNLIFIHLSYYQFLTSFVGIGLKLDEHELTYVSPQEAVCYESNKEKKKPFLELSDRIGAIGAIRKLTGVG